MGLMSRRAPSVLAASAQGKGESGPDERGGSTSGAKPKGFASISLTGIVWCMCSVGIGCRCKAELGDALKAVKDAGLIPEDTVRLCVVCDGADWIWEHVEGLFPNACQVLDYDPCSEYLHRMAKVQYESPLQGHEWVEMTLTRLYLGQVGGVLGGLKRLKPTSEEAKKAIDNCWIYLHGHRKRTQYQSCRRGGYPLGSGGMESANKFICHTRLKRSGAGWYETNSNQMLALRCAKYNGTFDQVFRRYQKRLSEAVRNA
jgi:hypothetical protein